MVWNEINSWRLSTTVVDDDKCKLNRINPITNDRFDCRNSLIMSLTKKVVLNITSSLAEVREMTYLCTVNKNWRVHWKSVHIKVDRDTLQIFYEMPSKALLAMAGLNRKVLNSRRITKLVAPSNPVFSRSFITSFGVAFYKRGAECWHVQLSAPFLLRQPRFPMWLCH